MNAPDPAYVFAHQNGSATKDLYDRLDALGPAGKVALNLFRACKRSGRAKDYRNGKWRRQAYDVKQWSMGNLCRELGTHADALGIEWGWKIDPAQSFHKWVLYVVIPTGQVSFHNETRLCDRDFPGEWDGSHASPQRIIAWTTKLLSSSASTMPEASPR